MRITEFLKENRIILDGGMGTQLQAAGLPAGELPERWNITHPEVIKKIHKSYFDAGSNLVLTNTFGANLLKFSKDELEKIVSSAIKNARDAAEESRSEQPKWVALDVGPTGRMLKPLGDLDFEDAVGIFAYTVRLGKKYGADLIFIETMNDSYETKAALLAAKENCDLPVFVSNAYGEDGKLMSGADPRAMIALLEGMGADAIGMNCSLGPEALSKVAREYIKYSSTPIIMKPNAGLPTVKDGETVYDLSSGEFAAEMASAISLGVNIVGGCCGTTPEYISALASSVEQIPFAEVEKKDISLVSSYTHALVIGEKPLLIGERINPTGKPKFKEALRTGDIEYVLREGIAEEEQGAHILDVNLGLPGIDEGKMLCRAVCELQSVIDLPLQIDSSDASAMEKALRRYNGKAMINSLSGKAESMSSVFPLVKKYGGVVVALTLDENGIPKTAEERVKIAERILLEAKKWGIDKKNIIFDPLTMAVSADRDAPRETLSAVKMISEKLGCHTLLGVSNVSFGLPDRDTLNAAFFTLALENGLDAAIMNPHSEEMMKAYRAYNALNGMDAGFEKYISLSSNSKPVIVEEKALDLKGAIIRGLKEMAANLACDMLKNREPLDVINSEIIPALNTVGEGFEKKRIYLPGLLMSAEAAGSAVDIVKSKMPEREEKSGCKILLATVKGDIHDIGKNIVKLLLESYGFSVTDLGRDVLPERVVSEAKRMGADIVGLSALMTTTVPSMEETISLLKKEYPSCKIMVGGAVLTKEYAEKIGADFYGTDAIDAVKFAQNVNIG